MTTLKAKGNDPLYAISPIDGRYKEKTQPIGEFFSEFALMKYRVFIEIHWLIALCKNPLILDGPKLDKTKENYLHDIYKNFSLSDAKKIKTFEKKIKHDIKAVEYFLQEKIKNHADMQDFVSFIHFACTSEDINNISYSLMLKDCVKKNILPQLTEILQILKSYAKKYASEAMIARTHGQIATPTTIGKEFANFAYRLENLLKELKTVKFFGKINGAVGNFNAHVVAYPKINWLKVSENFITSLNLSWNKYTTQIEPHDFIATFSNTISHINTVLIDLARDMWGYIAFNYFQQEANKKEVGSSTMPHKINPIDFENAEGNLGIANALLNFFANKLPISRMQRDLSDSTVLRNLGVTFAHTYLAYQSLEAGLKKITTNKNVIAQDLHAHYEVLAEAIQTVMRKYKIAAPYEKLKSFTRGKIIDKNLLHKFIATLSLPENEKINLKNLTPEKYTGLAIKLAKEI